jgi:hypothetical protein
MEISKENILSNLRLLFSFENFDGVADVALVS